MESRYKASIYNYLFNSINTVVMIVNGIVMVPIYFHYMSVSTYGAWLASGNLVAMIGLLESGFSSVITQKMAAAIGIGDKKEYLILAGSNIMTAGLISVMIFIFGSCFIPYIADIVNTDSESTMDITIAFTLSLLSSAIAVLVSLLGAFPQVWQETKQVGIINTIVNIVAIGVMIISLIIGGGVISLALGYLARSSLNLIFQGWWILKHWKMRDIESPIYNFKSSFLLFKECFYPLIARVSGVLMGQSQSFVLAAFMAPALAAIYDITSKIMICTYGFVGIANGSFFAFLSITFGKNDRHELNRVVGNIIQYFTMSVVAVFIFGVCFSKFIIYYWVGLEKFGGDWLLLLIGVSMFVNQYKVFFNNLLFSSGNIKKSSIIDICSLLLYFLMIFTTIKYLQVYSIPISLLLTNAVFGGWYLHVLFKNTKILHATILSPMLKNILVSIPIVILYLICNFEPSDYLLFVVLFVSLFIIFLLAIMHINPSVKLQIYRKLCK